MEEKKAPKYTIWDIVSIIAVLSLIVVVFLQVLSRFVFKSGGAGWTDELSRIIFITIVYISMGTVVREDANFKVDTIIPLPGFLATGLQVVIKLAEIGIMLMIAISGVTLVRVAWNDVTPALGWTASIFYIPLIIGSLGYIWETLKKMVALLRKPKREEGI